MLHSELMPGGVTKVTVCHCGLYWQRVVLWSEVMLGLLPRLLYVIVVSIGEGW